MRNSFDWTPYRRSTVGFDRLFDFLETSGSGAENYPPFDIEKVADDHFRITVAVAGLVAHFCLTKALSLAQATVVAPMPGPDVLLRLPGVRLRAEAVALAEESP